MQTTNTNDQWKFIKSVRFKANGEWGEWQEYDKKNVPENMSAMETREFMTVAQIKELKEKGLL